MTINDRIQNAGMLDRMVYCEVCRSGAAIRYRGWDLWLCIACLMDRVPEHEAKPGPPKEQRGADPARLIVGTKVVDGNNWELEVVAVTHVLTPAAERTVLKAADGFDAFFEGGMRIGDHANAHLGALADGRCITFKRIA